MHQSSSNCAKSAVQNSKRYASLTKKLKRAWDYLFRTGPDAAGQTGSHIHTNESQIQAVKTHKREMVG